MGKYMQAKPSISITSNNSPGIAKAIKDITGVKIKRLKLLQ